jgi:hypothetical protein
LALCACWAPGKVAQRYRAQGSSGFLRKYTPALSVKHQYRCALQRIRFIDQPGGSAGEGKLKRGKGGWKRAQHDGSPVVVMSLCMLPFWGAGCAGGIGEVSVVL